MRALGFVYIIEKVAHAHAQNAPHECVSTPWLEAVPGLLSEICWLRIRCLTFVKEAFYTDVNYRL